MILPAERIARGVQDLGAARPMMSTRAGLDQSRAVWAFSAQGASAWLQLRGVRQVLRGAARSPSAAAVVRHEKNVPILRAMARARGDALQG